MSDVTPSNPQVIKLLNRIKKTEQGVVKIQSECEHDWIVTDYGCSGDYYEREYWKSIMCKKCVCRKFVDQNDPLYRSVPTPQSVHDRVRAER